MKKIGNLILAICSLFLLSGCMKHNVSMTINKDKSMDLEIIYAIDVDQIEGMMNSFNDTTDDSEMLDETLDDSNDIDDDDMDEAFTPSSIDTEEEKKALEKRGYKVVEYDNDGYKGIKATLRIDNIDNVSVEEDLKVKLSDILDENFDDEEFFTVKKGFFKNTYIANFVYEKAGEDSSSNPITNLSNLDIKYTVTLPDKSISNNADTVRENELSWDISLDKTTNIEYSFEMLNTTNILITVGGIGVLLLVVIIVIIVLASKKKHKDKNITNNTNIEETSVIDNSMLNVEQDDIISNIDMTITNMDDSNTISNEMPNIDINTDLNIQQQDVNNTIDTIPSEDAITNTMMLDTGDIQNDTEQNKPQIKTCPQCGVEVLENQKFCENCGKQLN